MPGASPSRNTLAEVADRRLSAAPNAAGEPDAMKVSSPDSARARPPDIGESSSSWPDLRQPLASARLKAAGTVAHCITILLPALFVSKRKDFANTRRRDWGGLLHISFL